MSLSVTFSLPADSSIDSMASDARNLLQTYQDTTPSNTRLYLNMKHRAAELATLIEEMENSFRWASCIPGVIPFLFTYFSNDLPTRLHGANSALKEAIASYRHEQTHEDIEQTLELILEDNKQTREDNKQTREDIEHLSEQVSDLSERISNLSA
jgi:peptidoglycan hydrolase CwlO-like protein